MAKAGDDLEKIVTLIEKSISVGSTVQQNVFLPVINSPSGRTRQCDVVITSGSDARKTTTIIEVQDRNSAVSIETFGGWLLKLEEVGANQLICISRKDFPISVKEKAILHGNRVLLITLKVADPESLPIGMVRFHAVYQNLYISDPPQIKCRVPHGTLIKHKNLPSTGLFSDKIWSVNKQDFISLWEIVELEVKKKHINEFGIIEGSLELTLSNNTNLKLFTLSNNEFIEVIVEMSISYIYDNHNVPMTISSYEQLDSGILAWVFESELVTTQGRVRAKYPITSRSDGTYLGLGVIYYSDFDIGIKIVDALNG